MSTHLDFDLIYLLAMSLQHLQPKQTNRVVLTPFQTFLRAPSCCAHKLISQELPNMIYSAYFFRDIILVTPQRPPPPLAPGFSPCAPSPWLGKSPTWRRHVGPTAKNRHIWPTGPRRADTNSFPTHFFVSGIAEFLQIFSSTRGT